MKSEGFFLRALQIIFRRASINAVIFFIVTFLIGEITAISQGQWIADSCDEYLKRNDSNTAFFIISIIRIFFTEGSPEIVLTSFLVLAPFLYLKYLEFDYRKIKNRDREEIDVEIEKNDRLKLIIFISLILFVSFGIYFLLSKFDFENKETIFPQDEFVESEKLSGNSWRFRYNYSISNDGVVKIYGKQYTNDFMKWEGVIILELLNANNEKVHIIKTKKFVGPSRGLGKGESVQDISFDTLIPNFKPHKIKLIKHYENGNLAN